MKNRVFRSLMGGLALFSLAVCLIMGALVFLGRVSDATFKTVFLAASAGWFVCSIARGKRDKGPSAGENGA